MKNPTASSRRSILKAAAALAGPMIVAPRVLGLDGVAPSNRIAIGFIGVGNHGHNYNLKSFLNESDMQAVAVCDVYADRAKAAAATAEKKQGAGCRQYGDFRELLAAKDIDAVCISTPDHWHVPISTMAIEAGKDVMCEKPTLTIAEGRALTELVKKSGKVFQIGLEDRSVIQYHMLAEWVRNGAIGKLHTIRVKLPKGDIYKKEEPAPVPAWLNWAMWQGPAPEHPFTPTRTGPMQWRNIRMYGGGLLADWGAHILDTANVANFAEETGPTEVEGSGFIPPDAMNTMPVTFNLKYKYGNGVEMFVESGAVALKFEGDKGWVGNTGWRGRPEASDPAILQIKYKAGESKLWARPPGEHRDFLNCVKARSQRTTYPAEHAHRLSTTMHVGAIAMELGRKMAWDPAKEEFVGDEAANKLRSRISREDWKTKA
ncbi:MAG: Gfo/Idh/MocA family protein [Phycisphaerae bacterium]